MTQHSPELAALVERIKFLRIDFPGRWSEYLTDRETELLLSTLGIVHGEIGTERER